MLASQETKPHDSKLFKIHVNHWIYYKLWAHSWPDTSADVGAIWLLATLYLRQVWPSWQVFGWQLSLDMILLGSTCHRVKTCGMISLGMAKCGNQFASHTFCDLPHLPKISCGRLWLATKHPCIYYMSPIIKHWTTVTKLTISTWMIRAVPEWAKQVVRLEG